MQCTHCGGSNPTHARFCIECGTPFFLRCHACGAENPPRAKFCASCGTPLAATSVAPVSSSEFQVSSSPQPPVSQTSNSEPRTSQPPSSYTPARLAERIRAATLTEG